MSNGILKNKSIVVIGAGNMGGAILTGAVKSGVATAADVTAVDLDEGLLAQHKDQLGVKTSTDAGSVVGDADLILLALKPQIWKAVVNLFAGAVSPTATVVSIMAGIRTDALEKVFSDGVAIVRSMPNLMAQVGEAASGLCAGRAAREDNLAQAEALLGAVGMTVRVDESQMDAVTGLSGSARATDRCARRRWCARGTPETDCPATGYSDGTGGSEDGIGIERIAFRAERAGDVSWWYHDRGYSGTRGRRLSSVIDGGR